MKTLFIGVIAHHKIFCDSILEEMGDFYFVQKALHFFQLSSYVKFSELCNQRQMQNSHRDPDIKIPFGHWLSVRTSQSTVFVAHPEQ